MSSSLTSPSQYRCFENSIRLYKFFGFFTEHQATPVTWPRRVMHLMPWLSWCWFFLSILLNLGFVLKNYLTNPGSAIKGTEIFQRVFEIFLAPLFGFEMHYFVTSYYTQVQEMRRSFDTHPAVTAQCKAKEKKVLILSIAMVLVTMCLAYYRKLFFGLPPNEVELVQYYYHKARPERQLPFIMWFPFDDTVNPFYYLALAMNVYLLLLTGLLATHINSCMLIFAIHLQGQFLILAKYLHNIGNPHLFVYRDSRAEVSQRGDHRIDSVRLMNLKSKCSSEVEHLRLTTDRYELNDKSQNGDKSNQHHEAAVSTLHLENKNLNPSSRVTNLSIESPIKVNCMAKSTCLEDNLGPEYFANLQRALAEGRNFEQDCLTLVIRRHQYLIDFRNRLEQRFKVMIVSKMFTYIALTISLYQLSFVSKIDAFAMQLFLQLLATMSFCFVITHASELLERGNESMRSAAYENNWTRKLVFAHASRTSTHAPKKSYAHALLLFTLMCDRSLRLKYFGGALELCYRSFVTVLRFCYSLFALMKRSIQVK